MPNSSYLPIFELTRGEIVESIHFGAVAVVDARGNQVASYGDPHTVTFLRSTAKPLQLISFLEHGGQAAFNLTPREIALMCASHSGTDEHVAVAQSIQGKTGVAEAELLCGVHYPYHEATAEAMRERREAPTPNRHNCSGKHMGMLAYSRLLDLPAEEGPDSLPYIDLQHPVQQRILNTLAEMGDLPAGEIATGIDGCSAPVFAVPLQNAAFGLARLCDPETGNVQPPARAAACRSITSAMIFNPDMVAGPARFDTALMEVGQGRILAKGGAEGYQGIGLLPGALGPGSPALGITIKISDGDLKGRARPAVALEVLRQLGALSSEELGMLTDYGPTLPILNWRKLVVGEGRPCFALKR